MTASELKTEAQEIVGALIADGLKVYMREPDNEHCFVTDGNHIAYVQWVSWSDNRISTVHKANRQTGTGFGFADKITPKLVRGAMELVAPGWATAKDRESVRKYKDWEEFHNESNWNQGLKEVTL